jgi:hypothetical protein
VAESLFELIAALSGKTGQREIQWAKQGAESVYWSYAMMNFGLWSALTGMMGMRSARNGLSSKKKRVKAESQGVAHIQRVR